MGNAKTTEFLKECLADALIKLLKAKSFDKITIYEIAQTADVGRTTFFRNFSNKSELITYKLVKLWERWTHEHNLEERSKFTLSNAVSFFEFNYSIKELLVLIYNSNLQSTLYEAFYTVMKPPIETDTGANYESKFFSYGLFGLLDEWVKQRFEHTPKQMAQITTSIIQGH